MRLMITRSLRALGLVGLLAGCSSGLALPDRSDPSVQESEAGIAALVQSSSWVKDGRCEARLLREEGDTSWAWVECAGRDGEVEQGMSVPVRVEMAQVSVPKEASYADDVRRLFPEDLADAVLRSDPALRP